MRDILIEDKYLYIIDENEKKYVFNTAKELWLCINLNYDLNYFYINKLRYYLKQLEQIKGFMLKLASLVEENNELLDKILKTYIEYMSYCSLEDRYMNLGISIIEQSELEQVESELNFKYFDDSEAGLNGYYRATRIKEITPEIIKIGLEDKYRDYDSEFDNKLLLLTNILYEIAEMRR